MSVQTIAEQKGARSPAPLHKVPVVRWKEGVDAWAENGCKAGSSNASSATVRSALPVAFSTSAESLRDCDYIIISVKGTATSSASAELAKVFFHTPSYSPPFTCGCGCGCFLNKQPLLFCSAPQILDGKEPFKTPDSLAETTGGGASDSLSADSKSADPFEAEAARILAQTKKAVSGTAASTPSQSTSVSSSTSSSAASDNQQQQASTAHAHAQPPRRRAARCVLVSFQNGARNPSRIRFHHPSRAVLAGVVNFNAVWAAGGALVQK